MRALVVCSAVCSGVQFGKSKENLKISRSRVAYLVNSPNCENVCTLLPCVVKPSWVQQKPPSRDTLWFYLAQRFQTPRAYLGTGMK
jgi:hypothetical protein